MRVRKLLGNPRLHGGRHFRRDRSSRLIVQVDHAALDAARSRIRRHSATKRSTSSSLVSGPRLTRITQLATSVGTPIASRTRLGFMLPDEQALPAEIAIPARPKCTSWFALATPGIA